jgi:hypothetical protein
MESFEAARAALIHIDGDSRVPMMQVYQLFKGTGMRKVCSRLLMRARLLVVRAFARAFTLTFISDYIMNPKGNPEKANLTSGELPSTTKAMDIWGRLLACIEIG